MKTSTSPGKTGGNFYGLGTYLGLAGALLAMIALFSVLSDHFLSYDTFSTLANQIPDLMVLAVGMTFILIIGGIDLSVGSVLALAASAVSVAILGWGLTGIYVSRANSVLHNYLYRRLPEIAAAPDSQTDAIAAPRGEAKSTLVSQLFVLWCLVTGRKKYPVIP